MDTDKSGFGPGFTGARRVDLPLCAMSDLIRVNPCQEASCAPKRMTPPGGMPWLPGPSTSTSRRATTRMNRLVSVVSVFSVVGESGGASTLLRSSPRSALRRAGE